MKFKGTKGEWFGIEYSGIWNIQSGQFYGDDNLLDCECYPREEVEANAKLIAAAPDLLEALINIRKLAFDKIHSDEGGIIEELCDKAIEKALK